MKAKFVFILFCVCMIAGGVAASGQQVYPVQGPLAAQTPPPVLTAKFSGTRSGKVTLVQPNGESFRGTWEFVTPSFVNAKAPGSPASYPPQPNLAFAWDAVYGHGYFLAKVLGKQLKQAVVTGDQGTVLQLEYVSAEIFLDGVAVDNRGNIYKVVL